MKPTHWLLPALVVLTSIAGCDDAEKKKAELLAKTGAREGGAALVDAAARAPAMAASSAAPAVKPPKECPSGPAVPIEDPDLEANIRLKLNKPKDKSPGALSAADLAQVRSVDLTKKKSLDELDACVFPKLTGLKHLYLGPGKLSNLSPISNLVQLESLRASINEVSDLKPLEKLVMLDRVDLGRTHVRDLGPLANLVNLTELELDDTQVSDLSPLAKCKKLEVLSIKNTLVTDVSPLKDLTKLKQLRVQGTALTNIDALAPLTARGLKIVTK